MRKPNKNFWKNKNVFITGHTGFKGSWLCIYLNLLGAKVTGYSLKPNTVPSLFNLAKIKKIIKKSIFADVKDFSLLFKTIKKAKPQIIFHLAAQPLVRYSYDNPKETFETNMNGTLNILECIKRIKTIKTGVIVTTDKVYKTNRNRIFNERDQLGGADPYSASKVCCEFLTSSYIQSFLNNSKQNVATARSGNVIGGGDFAKDRLVPDILKARKDIVIRNPHSIRPWQHVLDPLNGYIILAEHLIKQKKPLVESSWNFAPNKGSFKTVKEMTNIFSKNLKKKIKIKKMDGYRKEAHVLKLSNIKAKKILGWSPKLNFTQSIQSVLNWSNDLNKKGALKLCQQQIKNFLD